MQEHKSDWSNLMRAANRGDASAYARLLRELAPVLRRTVGRGMASCDPADCEDVVQEALLALHLKRHTWDEERPFLPWALAIARNKLADALRRRRARPSLPIEDFAELLPADPVAHPDRLDLKLILSRLNGRTREIVASISIEGASARQVAERFGMTEVAVRVAFHRGVASMARAASDV